MKINYNMPAYVANSKLLQNENALTASLEKLSSGYRINHAKDDPAGMAISSKMRTQIKGLEQASRNAADGNSVLETAEGALQEVTSIIQRMRELAVQAGNDSYGDEDREAMQDEIEALKKEVDRISTDTEFNKKTLLDGSLCSRIYANTRSVSLVEVSDSVDTGDYNITVTEDARHAVVTAKPANYDDFTKDAAGKPIITEGQISINGVVVRFQGGESEQEVYQMLRDACEKAEVNLYALDKTVVTPPLPGPEHRFNAPESEGFEELSKTFDFTNNNQLAFVSKYSGSNERVEIKCSDEKMEKFFGLATTTTETGKDVKIELGTPFSNQATAMCDGKTVKITDLNGFEMSFDVAEASKISKGAGGVYAEADLDVKLQVTDIGNLYLQVGANQYQTIEVDIPCMSSESLRIDTVDVTTVFGPDKAMEALDAALNKVNDVRSRLGATENRLDYAIDSLDQTDVNMNAALSRIEDVNMATEMSTYTQMNVLVQAATSVLAQANDLPEQTLQLLQ